MNRIYYNPTSGEISAMITGTTIVGTHDEPYIEVEGDIRLCNWKVDLETLELIPVVSTRQPLRR